MSKRRVFFAFDEAGHGDKKESEIIGGIVSIKEEDSADGLFPRIKPKELRSLNRTPEISRQCLIDAQQNYAFTILPSEEANKRGSNLVLLAPFLIKKLKKDIPLKYLCEADHVGVFLDGFIAGSEIDLLFRDFRKEFPKPEICIETFRKNGHKYIHGGRRPSVKCPKLLYMIDLRTKALLQDLKTSDNQLKDYSGLVEITEKDFSFRYKQFERDIQDPQSSEGYRLERIIYRAPRKGYSFKN